MERSRLLRHHPKTSAVEDLDGGGVGDEIGPILARARAGQSPVVQLGESAGNRSRRGVEHIQQRGVVHPGDDSAAAR